MSRKTLANIVEALQLIGKYCDKGMDTVHAVEGDHEIVYASPDKHMEDWLPEDTDKMEELGWHWHDDYECWAMNS